MEAKKGHTNIFDFQTSKRSEKQKAEIAFLIKAKNDWEDIA